MIDYLITGATGGLGRLVLDHLIAHAPDATIAASSSRESSRAAFEALGVQFRQADFDTPASLEAAFQGVRKLLFVSTNVFDNERRVKQHQNAVSAAKAAGVGHVYYTSLAFGGLGDHSEIMVQAVHLQTERMLREAGVPHTSVREGAYADAFPLFLDWYPSSGEVVLPRHEGRRMALAWASRTELGEATARVMMDGRWDGEEKILLSGPEATELADAVDAINDATGRDVKVRYVDPDEWVRAVMESKGEGSWKPEAFVAMRRNWYEGLAKGDGEMVTGTLEEALGRKPKTGREVIHELLKDDRDYRWHQNEPNDQATSMNSAK